MVGYSRLIGLDDSDTIARLQTLRRLLIDPAVDEHGGSIAQTAGDSLLIVFDSIDGAVRCAVEVQRHVPDHDGDVPPSRRIRFRIGINIGDVIASGTDLHGDGVNVAVRLQTECPEGGICVSQAVRDQVHDRLNLSFEELGPLTLKNISRPVRAFVVREREIAPPMDPSRMPRETPARPPAMSTELEPPRPDLAPPDKPSIVVLPFQNMSADPEQEYFSDGVAEDIITQLSRSHALFVIARNSSFTYNGRAVDVKQVGRELGVRYVLEGSIRRARERVRISAQLVEADTGNHIWAERYDRALSDIFAVQDEISDAVATAIGPAVADAEMHRAMRRPPASLGAWDLYQQGMWHLRKQNPEGNDEARRLFERAIERDPLFVAAYTGLSLCYTWAGSRYQTVPLDDAIRLSSAHARKAVELDRGDADAQATLARTLFTQGDMDSALVMARQALSINPNCAMAHRAMGWILIFVGRMAEGRQALGVFERLSPRDADIAAAHSQIAISYYFERDYERCAAAVRSQLSTHPEFTRTSRWLAAALAQLGRTEEARAALEKSIASAPRVFDVFVLERVPWMRPEDYEHMLDGLRKAGWQG